MKKTVAFLLALGIAGFVISVTLVLVFLNKAPNGEEQEIIFDVVPKKSFKDIAIQLEEKKIIVNSKAFITLAKLGGYEKKIKIGEYVLKTNMLPLDILKIFASGKSIERAITFQEGLNIYEMGVIFERNGFGTKDEFIKLCTDRVFTASLLHEKRSSLEGYLFPETYKITKYTGAKALIKNMVNRFNVVFGEIQKQSMIKWNKNEIVIFASMIEKETGAPHERPIISSVFHNRLKANMKLQSDPTVIYGILNKTGKYIKNITKQNLTTPTKYNTYTQNGLPIGPIANPGKYALLATVNPISSEYLFFVSKNDGTHAFTKDYKKHLEAVKQYQLDPVAHEGKSWKELSRQLKTIH